MQLQQLRPCFRRGARQYEVYDKKRREPTGGCPKANGTISTEQFTRLQRRPQRLRAGRKLLLCSGREPLTGRGRWALHAGAAAPEVFATMMMVSFACGKQPN